MNTTNLNPLSSFIREHRSNESNFEILYARLEEEMNNKKAGREYLEALKEIKAKAAGEYKKARETNTTAWPEFEKFVSSFEALALQVK